MVSQQVTLPAMQLAAALFLAYGAYAADKYCVDTGDLIVEPSKCDGNGAAGRYFVTQGMAGGSVGSKIPSPVGAKIDSTDKTTLEKEGFNTKGFGVVQNPSTSGNSGSSSSSGGGGNAAAVAAS